MLIRLYGVTRIRELFIQEKLEEKRGRLMKHCMMKKLIFVWMTALLLCGAGALAEPEALTTKEDEHEVTFTAEQTSRNEYGESVYDIRVTMDGQQTQVISFTTEGTNEDEQEMYLTDVNMDGYPDLALLRSMGASDGFASHYVYDPAAGEFIYHPELNDLSWYRCAFYPDGRYVLNALHSGAATGTWMLYQWQKDGALKLLSMASLESSPDIEKDEYISTAMLVKDDDTLEAVYENTLTELDETMWNTEYGKLMAYLWNGIEPGEPAEWGMK